MRPILLTGAAGSLGQAFVRLCNHRAIAVQPMNRAALDIADLGAIERTIAHYRPWAVVNAAGHVRVDDAQLQPERCWRENVTGPMNLAQVCAAHDIPLLTFSSDLVFDGETTTPYVESQAPNPLSVYGHSKVVAESGALELHAGSLVIRTAAFFGPWDSANFADDVRRRLEQPDGLRLASDLTISPTYLPDLVHTCLDLLIDGETGVWHLSNGEALTWCDAGRRVADALHLDADLIVAVTADQLPFRAPRPRFSALGSERGMLLPTFSDALTRWASHVR